MKRSLMLLFICLIGFSFTSTNEFQEDKVECSSSILIVDQGSGSWGIEGVWWARWYEFQHFGSCPFNLQWTVHLPQSHYRILPSNPTEGKFKVEFYYCGKATVSVKNGCGETGYISINLNAVCS